jgi:hypothetical protein
VRNVAEAGEEEIMYLDTDHYGHCVEAARYFHGGADRGQVLTAWIAKRL